ncbi:hypothetical protein LXL04_032705 [Taraxacum kok-saghyz]
MASSNNKLRKQNNQIQKERTMNPKKSTFVVSFLIITIFVMLAYFYMGVERVEKDMIKFDQTGGIRDITEQGLNGEEMENLARFAVEEHNKKENTLLQFSRLVKAKEQVVAGMLYHLTLEATDADGNIKVYDTKVWVQQWNNFKQVQEFKAIDDPNVPILELEVQKAGEIHDYTEQGQELEDLARFALEDYSHYVNCIFEFHRVVKVKVKEGQLISGKMYHLTIETKGGTLYEAKVWVKPWKNIKELVEFEAIKAPNVNNW